MYAVLKIGGKQYKVEEGQEILVEKVFSGNKENLTPLAIVDEGGIDLSGKGQVNVSVLEETKGPKVIAFKYKPKKGYKKKIGHRQQYLKIRIDKISKAGEKPKKTTTSSAAKTKTSAKKKEAVK